jgi:hypothetical protein
MKTKTSQTNQLWLFPEAVMEMMEIMVEVMKLRLNMRHGENYGPYRLYYSQDLELTMNREYSSHLDITLKERIARIEGIAEIRMDSNLPSDSMMIEQIV